MRIFTGLFFGPQWFKNDLSFWRVSIFNRIEDVAKQDEIATTL
jgi:hypothetical protein